MEGNKMFQGTGSMKTLKDKEVMKQCGLKRKNKGGSNHVAQVFFRIFR